MSRASTSWTAGASVPATTCWNSFPIPSNRPACSSIWAQPPGGQRASIEFNPSEFTRIRLQYNHDASSRDGSNNDEAILQFLFGIGAHAAHTF